MNKLQSMRFTDFYINNPDFDILTFDFHNKAELTSLKLSDPSYLGVLKTYQRLMRISADEMIAEKMIDRNFNSAHSIASMPEHVFVRENLDIFNNNEFLAKEYHKQAVHIKTSSLQLYGIVKDLVASPHYRSATFNTTNQQINDYYKNIPSYEDMFGSLDYFEYDESLSLFGPAAYFYDIMKIVDDYITDPNMNPVRKIPKGYTLAERRPDLFNLKLTSENVNNIIPYIEIVNEVLCQNIELIADVDDAYRKLSESMYPFNLPYNRPLDEINNILDKLGTSSSEICKCFNRDEEVEVLLSGVVGFQKDNSRIYGCNTNFESELSIGDFVVLSDNRFKIKKIISNAELELDESVEFDSKKIEYNRIFKGSGTLADDGSNQIIGTNTQFTVECRVGDIIHFEYLAYSGSIIEIISNNKLLISNPIKNEFTYSEYTISRPAAGSFVCLKNEKKIIGINTGFTSEFNPGDQLEINENIYNIVKVLSDNELLLKEPMLETIGESLFTLFNSSFDVYREKIGLSQTNVSLLVNEDSTPEGLSNCYGYNLNINNLDISGAGIIGYCSGQTNVKGFGTKFLSEIKAGDSLIVENKTNIVKKIVSDTELIVENNCGQTAGASYNKIINVKTVYPGNGTIGSYYGDDPNRLVGMGTTFLADFIPGSQIKFRSGVIRTVKDIVSDTILHVNENDSYCFLDDSYTVIKYPQFQGTGHISFKKGDNIVIGDSTSFLSELKAGDTLIAGESKDVVEIVSDTKLIVNGAFQTNVQNSAYSILQNTHDNIIPCSGVAICNAQDKNVTGIDTAFTRDFAAGDTIAINGQKNIIEKINSDSDLVVRAFWNSTSGKQYTVHKNFELNNICANLPVVGSGSVGIQKGSCNVIGNGTSFTSEIKPGNQIKISGSIRTVKSIISDSELSVISPWNIDFQGKIYNILLADGLDTVDQFCKRTSLTRNELSFLFTQNLNIKELQANAAKKFYINNTDEDLSFLSIYNSDNPDDNSQRIDGLSLKRLDRINRFIRLSKITEFDFSDLDRIIDSSGCNEISNKLIINISQIIDIQSTTKLSVSELTSFWSNMETDRCCKILNTQSFFDSIYNDKIILRGSDPYTNPDVQFNPFRNPVSVWNIDDTTGNNLIIRNRLKSALKINENDLILSARYILMYLAKKSSGDFELNLTNLSWLYRLTGISGVSGSGIDELISLLWLLFYPEKENAFDGCNEGFVLSAENVLKIIDYSEWIKLSGFTVYQVQYICKGIINEKYRSEYSEDDLIKFVNSLCLKYQTLLVQTNSIDNDNSAEIFLHLVSLNLLNERGIFKNKDIVYSDIASCFPVKISSGSTTYGFNDQSFVSDLVSPAESKIIYNELRNALILSDSSSNNFIILSELFNDQKELNFLRGKLSDTAEDEKIEEVRQFLLIIRDKIKNLEDNLINKKNLQNESLLKELAVFLNTTDLVIKSLIDISIAKSGLIDYLIAFYTQITEGENITPSILSFIQVVSQWKILVNILSFSTDEINFIIHDSSTLHFNIQDIKNLKIEDVRSLYNYKKFRNNFNDTDSSLIAYFETASDDKKKIDKLCDITGWDSDQVLYLISYFWSGKLVENNNFDTIDGLLRLQCCFNIASMLGSNMEYLVNFYNLFSQSLNDSVGNNEIDSWSNFEKTASSCMNLLCSKYNGNDFININKDFYSVIDTNSRDALLGYAMSLFTVRNPEIISVSDLYKYLLIDLEMSSVAETSMMSQGIASVQLYMQRCRMMLEPGVVDVLVPEVWWQWISQYRVWEVNRKIFLYPENYIDPSLRTDASADFNELSSNLLQNDITQENVEKCFSEYMKDLTTLGSLCHVSSYNCKRTDPDTGEERNTLYLFARTNTQPYIYYYRTLEDEENWTPWIEIKLTIPASVISGVYSFNRLFVFWNEIEVVKTSTIKNQTSAGQTLTKATIKYSFLHHNNWSNPQTLKKDIVLNSQTVPDDSISMNDGLAELLISDHYYNQVPFAISTGIGSWGTGTISIKANKDFVIGLSTKFLTELQPGDNIQVAGYTGVVKNIVNDNVCYLVSRYFGAEDILSNFKIISSDEKNNLPEKLLVLYGASYCTDLYKDCIINYKSGLPYSNPENDEFKEKQNNLFVALNNARNHANASPHKDHNVVVINPGIIIDDNLVNSTTDIMFENYVYDISDPNTSLPIMPVIDRSNDIVYVVESYNALEINYWGNNFTGLKNSEVLHANKNKILFNKISSDKSSLLNVSNQPGWFIFNNSDESFLIKTDYSMYKLSDTIKLESCQTYMNIAVIASCQIEDSIENFKYSAKRITTSIIPKLNQRLFSGGIDKVLSVDSQKNSELSFKRFFNYDDKAIPDYLIAPKSDDIDFNGAYGLYFWEIFFHTPFLVASKLNQNQKYEDAQKWYQYIFDPTHQPDSTTTNSGDRFWQFLPFRSMKHETIIESLSNIEQIRRYNYDPFNPHIIAEYRQVAYAKAIVMQYIDNILDWGDFLFSQDTQEAITQATNLYVLAEDLLGDRPVSKGNAPKLVPKCYNELKNNSVDAPQFLIDIENTSALHWNCDEVMYTNLPLIDINTYFYIPENDEFIKYWDRVEDRLFKIRNCMNIQGTVRQLSIFAPPIDPALFVRAMAAGGSAITASAQFSQPASNYRYEYLMEKTRSLVSQLSNLGSMLLAALEKKDYEKLNTIKVQQEKTILRLTTFIKENEIEEAVSAGKSLAESLQSATFRNEYYTNLISEGISGLEQTSLTAMRNAMLANITSSIMKTAASIGYAVPQVGSPFAMTYGGEQIGHAVSAAASVLDISSILANFSSQQTQVLAGYVRRCEEWQLQKNLSSFDVNQINEEILSNKLREAIARQALQIHIESINQNDEIDHYYSEKFTGEALYQWLANRLSSVYFQTYSLAFDLAMATQRAYQYQFNTDRTFISYGYWDDLYKGLGAAEGLMLCLDQMEKEVIDNNERAMEIEKNISLMQIDPKALLDLKNNGVCTFDFTEKLFDSDFPGHYARKIKSISVSIPAIVGPYQNIKATLTQLSSKLVVKADSDGVNAVNFLLGGKNARTPQSNVLRSNWRVNQQIAISRANNDSGVFELNFQDSRYLPFEETGAVSSWKLSMPKATNRINFDSISDVIFTLRYTAYDGGSEFMKNISALEQLKSYNGIGWISLSQMYSSEWYQFIKNSTISNEQSINFTMQNFVLANINSVKVTGFYFRLDSMNCVPGNYIKFVINSNLNIDIQLSEKNDFSFNFVTEIPVESVVKNLMKIVFDISKTPDVLKNNDGMVLNCDVIKDIQLVFYYDGKVG